MRLCDGRHGRRSSWLPWRPSVSHRSSSATSHFGVVCRWRRGLHGRVAPRHSSSMDSSCGPCCLYRRPGWRQLARGFGALCLAGTTAGVIVQLLDDHVLNHAGTDNPLDRDSEPVSGLPYGLGSTPSCRRLCRRPHYCSRTDRRESSSGRGMMVPFELTEVGATRKLDLESSCHRVHHHLRKSSGDRP